MSLFGLLEATLVALTLVALALSLVNLAGPQSTTIAVLAGVLVGALISTTLLVERVRRRVS